MYIALSHSLWQINLERRVATSCSPYVFLLKRTVCMCLRVWLFTSYSVIDQSSCTCNEEKVSSLFYRSGFTVSLFLELQRRNWITGLSLEAFCMFVMHQNLKQLMIREKSSRKGEKLLQRRQEVTWTNNLLAMFKFLVLIIINLLLLL